MTVHVQFAGCSATVMFKDVADLDFNLVVDAIEAARYKGLRVRFGNSAQTLLVDLAQVVWFSVGLPTQVRLNPDGGLVEGTLEQLGF